MEVPNYKSGRTGKGESQRCRAVVKGVDMVTAVVEDVVAMESEEAVEAEEGKGAVVVPKVEAQLQ